MKTGKQTALCAELFHHFARFSNIRKILQQSGRKIARLPRQHFFLQKNVNTGEIEKYIRAGFPIPSFNFWYLCNKKVIHNYKLPTLRNENLHVNKPIETKNCILLDTIHVGQRNECLKLLFDSLLSSQILKLYLQEAVV